MSAKEKVLNLFYRRYVVWPMKRRPGQVQAYHVDEDHSADI